jgi:CubicO group peptidase (beta-lactamase class C family)
MKFSGVLSVVRKKECLYEDALGFSNADYGLKNNINTRYGIASGTKLFTALGIGALVEKQIISLNTQIGEFFEENLSFVDKTATIRNLMNHTSGIYDYYDEEKVMDFENYFVEIPWNQLETPMDYRPLFENKNMKYHAGERVSYSNGGYVFLGIIIEKLSGIKYRDFIQNNVLKPGEMNSSGFFAFNDLPENTAIGYLKKDNQNKTNISNLPMRGGGDGGLYTTNSDLIQFWRNLFDFKIVPEAILKDFITPSSPIGDSIDYGLGLLIRKRKSGTEYLIVGEDAGVGFYSGYMPEKDITVNVLSNKTEGAKGIADLLYERFIEKHDNSNAD